MADAFKLVSTSGEQTFDIKPGAPMVVGRAVSSDVPIYDPTISRQHAQLSAQANGVLVKDLGSSNGTFLNGGRITEAVATANDVVMFGKVSFYVREVTKAAASKPADAFPAPKPPQATIVRQLPLSMDGGIISGRVARVSTSAPAAAAVVPDAEKEEAAKKAKGLEVLLEISKALRRAGRCRGAVVQQCAARSSGSHGRDRSRGTAASCGASRRTF